MTKIVVIGNGMVGYKFCEKLRAQATEGDFEITVFGEEPWPAYDRVHLSAYFSGSTADDLMMAPRSWYDENNVDLHTNEMIVKIDRDAKKIISHTGHDYAYDKLILATGSAAFVPPIDGVDKKGVFVYRTLEDLDAIIDYSKKVKSAAVIGGGLLGLEAAKAVIDMGLDAHVIEFAPRLMPRQLDTAGSATLQAKLEALGIKIHLSKNTKKITGNGKITGMSFADNTNLNTEMLIISAGIKPRDELAKDAGLTTAPRGGIVVNEFLQTDDTDIYAIGEAASYQNMVYGLVAPGYEMATQVVNQLVNTEVKPFMGFDMSTKLKLIGVDVGSFGDPFGEIEPSKPIVYENKNSGIYKRINVSMDGKRLLGGILVGDASAYNILLQMTQNNMPLPPEPEDLILGARGGKEAAGAGVESLPEEAQVCSCENVTKGAICSLIENDGVTKVDEIKSCTKAGTGCGGCMPMVNDLLKHQLKSMGKTVKNVICEHFDYSRQELLDIVKVKGIKSYNELLDQFGQGDGCEVCKPAVASILASTWNELITKQDTIQDTNDRYLANIQKGGTYSVVPRIPGGEITPEKLIVLGDVAKRYNLYTKITGGQRIDLFGARVDQLPDIWEELIEAGFESGHAYGKSLRTIKSCVGSTWCRYGVQDSVSFAIEVEERYRGLRSPHKLKGAVSGCIRECAEAQSKDFGIIATEKGWNLYICGNGGSKPQHAQLLINDVDRETCLKYIDRFLMFYIRTAEPLTRTATWLNKLEGGMDYVRDVVVNDSLGIGEELEKEMAFMIDTYACEWKEVVNNPELRAKFKHFVNADEEDPNLKWQEMRGQKIPASWG
ncbi:nitrite reductase large subunit NirB [Echinicola vietnamensis]|uniref:NAD(P)H-dependent nitrite reductase, large subunit n=1 Tax=Echinicola vietnamensis (strain DSM 17526 / LMG 23754 / KMM 6221) TaxID=926556 RepID=L0FZH5_ECHVK|nr:nitrite reductase large subunit NirB [Echinicola vietnamensis]AGA78156.1 NAD(P)H-dependent nitrite reductase, large subunit [Echinicola vietnamensis DSM 17526]